MHLSEINQIFARLPNLPGQNSLQAFLSFFIVTSPYPPRTAGKLYTNARNMEQNKTGKGSTISSLLDPIERLTEISVGLIIALTFTGTLSVLDADANDVRNMLIGALGCNLAWGIIDGVIYLSNAFAQHGRENLVFNYIVTEPDAGKARNIIAQSMPAIVAETQSTADLEKIRLSLLSLPAQQKKPRLSTSDVKAAFLIVLLVFSATLPVVVPFVCTDNVILALRISNAVAVLSMFTCGWLLAGYCGYNKWKTGITMTFIGILLVAGTIALGG